MKTRSEIIKPLSNKEFQLLANPQATSDPSPDVDAYFANLLYHYNRFAIGTYCWFIADRLKGVTYSAGGNTAEIFGIASKELIGKGAEFVYKRTHPDDLPKMFAYSEYWGQFLAGTEPERRKFIMPCIFLRVLNHSNVYKWAMVQYLDVYFEKGGDFLYIFTTVTDVSHLMSTGEALMTIRDMEKNTVTCIRCREHGDLQEGSSPIRPITPREQEILKLLASGLSSKQIADQLNVSIHTVNNHRQSLLRKAGAKSTAELVSYGVLMGHLAW